MMKQGHAAARRAEREGYRLEGRGRRVNTGGGTRKGCSAGPWAIVRQIKGKTAAVAVRARCARGWRRRQQWRWWWRRWVPLRVCRTSQPYLWFAPAPLLSRIWSGQRPVPACGHVDMSAVSPPTRPRAPNRMPMATSHRACFCRTGSSRCAYAFFAHGYVVFVI